MPSYKPVLMSLPGKHSNARFRAVKCLTDYDAHAMAADAFGILVNNLSPQDAAALRGAFRVENVETEVVDDSTLPVLPPSKMVQRLECLSAGQKVFDPMGRSFGVNWGHVMLVAAGHVKLTVDLVAQPEPSAFVIDRR